MRFCKAIDKLIWKCNRVISLGVTFSSPLSSCDVEEIIEGLDYGFVNWLRLGNLVKGLPKVDYIKDWFAGACKTIILYLMGLLWF